MYVIKKEGVEIIVLLNYSVQDLSTFPMFSKLYLLQFFKISILAAKVKVMEKVHEVKK
jgi:hypothetical protein